MKFHTYSSGRSRRSFVLAALVGVALLLTGAFASGAQARVTEFQALAPSSVPLTAVTTDPATGLIYAQENRGTSFFVYDPRTNAWTELAEAPIDSGNNGGAAYLDGKIYVSYTGNSDEMSVYDIASNSWTTIENPLQEGTGAITAGNGKLYLVVGREFFELDPATDTPTELAEPPPFVPQECYEEEGFEPWGGLQFDGGKIYGDQGDGCTGFAVYDIASNSWSDLPSIPGAEEEGAVAGSALNPVTNTYLAYGPYGGETLFRYDLDAGSWSTSPLPFDVDDGGMAYVSIPGYEGVYMIQGEDRTEFTRYTEKNETDLSTSISAAVAGTHTGGEITYSIQVKNNGPEHAGGVALSDPLPAGSTLVSAGATQGSCTGTSTVSCSLGGLASGASAGVTIKAMVGFGTFTDTATVSSLAIDNNKANDSASVTSTLARPCVVPKVKKLRVKKAKKALRAAGCKPGKVQHRFSKKIKKGRVIRSSKHRGKRLPPGAKVKLTVSRGPKPQHHQGQHSPKGHQ
jgi:uncharacterized repeat protein (TIGR01451 family)